MCYRVTLLKFVAMYAHFGNLWAKKGFWGLKQCCLGKKMHYYMVCIAYAQILLCKFAITR